jgi:hypothetical protein
LVVFGRREGGEMGGVPLDLEEEELGSAPVSLVVGMEGGEPRGVPLDPNEEKPSSKTDEIATMAISRRASTILSLSPFRLSRLSLYNWVHFQAQIRWVETVLLSSS